MEEEVKEFWEEIEWEIQAYIEWVRKRREKEGREIQKYCAVNFINGYKDEPDIMQEVFRHVAKKITAKGECKAYAQEVLV